MAEAANWAPDRSNAAERKAVSEKFDDITYLNWLSHHRGNGCSTCIRQGKPC